MRLRQTEFRWSRSNQKFEITMWHENNETCCTVAYFVKTAEGFDMVTVGQRFFKTGDNFFVAKHAIAYLQDLWEVENDNE